jgi:hypothetical protein
MEPAREPTTGRWWIPLSVVSGSLVALSIAAALFFGQRQEAAAPSPAPLSSRIGLAARAALVALGSNEEEFEAARAELLEVMEARRDVLPEDAHTTLAENLEIIEGQIAAISEELTKDPENQRLARMLAAAYRQELELLQKAAALPTVGEPVEDS